ncbi:MAG: four helix bundle protein [Nitrospirae bacterium]|nr:four helix bundle protein [Nitrospirota bacterium]
MKTHKNLDVWNKAMEFAEKLYCLTAKFPKEEQYGMVSQIRRSAVSIPSNIAEGAARNSNKEFVQFLYVALGSLSEVETQLILAKRLKFINLNENDAFNDIESIRKMLLGLIRFFKKKKNE